MSVMPPMKTRALTIIFSRNSDRYPDEYYPERNPGGDEP
jgi:hypothetical protein